MARVQECITRCDAALNALTEVNERQADEIMALDEALLQEKAAREADKIWYKNEFFVFVLGVGLGLWGGSR